jgi:hypothetical protein
VVQAQISVSFGASRGLAAQCASAKRCDGQCVTGEWWRALARRGGFARWQLQTVESSRAWRVSRNPTNPSLGPSYDGGHRRRDIGYLTTPAEPTQENDLLSMPEF